ncbi:MAG TPA: hypothetical protein VN927_04295, partial [Gemmatimonadaceae bacterium]|nr:hypothetical protein [Gemmatimonadaceae bacterium]
VFERASTGCVTGNRSADRGLFLAGGVWGEEKTSRSRGSLYFADESAGLDSDCSCFFVDRRDAIQRAKREQHSPVRNGCCRRARLSPRACDRSAVCRRLAHYLDELIDRFRSTYKLWNEMKAGCIG